MNKKESKRTKQLKTSLFWINAATFLTTTFPLIFSLFWGLADGDIQKGQKVFLGMTFISAIVLYIINVAMKYDLRSPLFLMLLGIYFALNEIMAVLVIITIGTCLDEFVLTPLKKKVKTQLLASKEIDMR
jgi:hypothetical protein